jgi:hypothetical protein
VSVASAAFAGMTEKSWTRGRWFVANRCPVPLTLSSRIASQALGEERQTRRRVLAHALLVDLYADARLLETLM